MNLKEIQQTLATLSQENPFTYEHFAKQPEYVRVNRALVQRLFLLLPDNFFHVDVATGTGLVPKLLIEEARGNNHAERIIGVDPNSTSLEIAKRTTPKIGGITVDYLEGTGQDLQQLLLGRIPQDGVDSVSIHDALHEIRSKEDKIKVVQNMADILKLKGIFSFNSAFTTEAVKVDARGWAGWKIRAMEILGGKRDKQAETMPIYTPAEYKEIMQNAGLSIIHETQERVMLSKDALEAISMYPAFIRGVFEDMKGHEDISEEYKSGALKQALDDRNIIELPRVWYEVVAQKLPSPLAT